jgi:glycine/D-amino acid oxidase-like deaminating enzyme
MLVEAKTIGDGVTKNTTAKITSQHGMIYSDLIKAAGEEKASMYLKANQWALEKFGALCQNIDCNFEEKSAFVYTLTDYHKVERELHALESLNFPAFFVQKLPLPIEVAGAIEFEKQAQFHPLKFLGGIAKDLQIHENTFVHLIDGHTALTNRGRIKAKKIIVATHFPFMNQYGNYFIKLYQHRSYVIALENAVNVEGMYVDEAQNGMSFRNYQNLLFIGGGDHRTGKKGGKWQELRTFAKYHYPEAKEVYAWATQDCMSLDNIPYIGPYAKSTPDIFVATGFNKWGMTSAMVAARILTDLLSGKKNDFADVYTTRRSIIKPQLFVNGLEATLNIITPTKKRCPHLGCALKWNAEEQSWDCPCHGSRFSADGRLLDNPALKPLDKSHKNHSPYE